MLVAEDRALDHLRPRGAGDAHRDRVHEVGRLARTRLLHDDAALARERRRVHVVDVVDEAREQPAQHRDRDRPDVELGDGPRVLDRDLGRRVGRELGEKAPELLAEQEVRPQQLQHLGTHRRHVDGRLHLAAHEEVGDLLGDRDRDVDLRLAGRGAEVRRHDHLRQARAADGPSAAAPRRRRRAPRRRPFRS